jgi:peroxiredoxin
VADRRGLTIALAVGAILLVGAGVLLGRRGRGPAPDFAVPDLGGRAVRLSALRGKVVLVNVWTTWCPPCREEMPSMQKLYERMRGRDFELLAVSQDEGGQSVVEPFVKDMKLSFPVLVDPERQVGERFGVWGYPETFVIDRNGFVVDRVIGPRDWSAPAEVARIEALLAPPAGEATPAAADTAPSPHVGLAPKAGDG